MFSTGIHWNRLMDIFQFAAHDSIPLIKADLRHGGSLYGFPTSKQISDC